MLPVHCSQLLWIVDDILKRAEEKLKSSDAKNEANHEKINHTI